MEMTWGSLSATLVKVAMVAGWDGTSEIVNLCKRQL